LILHEIDQSLLRNDPTDDIRRQLQDAEICIAVLSFCASRDNAAAKFLRIARPYYDKLFVAAQSGLESPMWPAFDKLNAELVTLIARPFCQPDRPSAAAYFLWKPQESQTGLPTRGSSGLAPLAESLETSCALNFYTVDGTSNDGMINDLLSGLRPGYFMDGYESYSWEDGYTRLIRASDDMPVYS